MRRIALRFESALLSYPGYALAELFGEWTLVREWGRIGSSGTVRLDWFQSESEAEAAGRKLGREKERRGYRAVS
jgi:predicted DNA-binding WGR domain protein